MPHHHQALESFEIIDTDPGAAPSAALDQKGWIPAVAPGSVHAALVRAGRIPHPYRDANAADVRWVEDRAWWYRGRFSVASVPAVPMVLQLNDLDTAATIWLNGEELGGHANVFRPALFDVSDRLRAGENELLIRFDPPLSGLSAPEQSIDAARRVAAAFGVRQAGEGHGLFGDVTVTRRRKPAVSWGWDFAPRVPSIGITGAVLLDETPPIRIRGQRFRTLTIDTARQAAKVRIDADVEFLEAATAAEITVRLTSPKGIVYSARAQAVAGSNRFELEIRDVELWWTHDLGSPALYELAVDLVVDGSRAHSSTTHVGIRTIELDTTADAAGNTFTFLLNGTPVYARGACVVPSDIMLGSASRREAALVDLAAEAGMNMLRVWGGGGYASDEFYDRADERGLLVWQDFAFACMDYPSDDDALRMEVEAEARYQILRLRDHPSLAIWVGNNEVHAMHQLAYGNLEPGPWGYDFFNRLLPDLVRELDDVPYWPGSPYGVIDPAGANGVADGDRHAWEVWHGLPLGVPTPEEFATLGAAMHFRRYRWDTGRFISEFGLGSAPSEATTRFWIEGEELRLDSPVYLSHICDEPKNKAEPLLAIESGTPTTVEEHIRLTQMVQAEGLKFGIEHYRSQQPHNSGALVWQLNDSWPGFSWSLIDYGMVPKAAYFAVKRAFAPVATAFRETENGERELWVVNSTRQPTNPEFTIRVESLTDGILVEHAVRTSVAPGESQCIWRSRDDAIDWTAGHVVRCSDAAGTIPANRSYFAPLKDIPFPDPEYSIQVANLSADEADVTITAVTALHHAHLVTGDPGAIPDDDYLDLAAGDTATIRVRGFTTPPRTEAFTIVAYSHSALSAEV